MAKRSDFARRKNDAYMTPEKGMYPLLPFLKDSIGRPMSFIEPCAGDGKMVEFFVNKGHTCVDHFDIEPLSPNVKEKDAFDYPVVHYQKCDYIITNPPWTRKILHPMIDLFAGIRPTWLLFDADWAYTKQSIEYLEYCHKIVNVGRLKWIKDSPYSGKDNVSWYLFDKNTRRDTEGPVFYNR